MTASCSMVRADKRPIKNLSPKDVTGTIVVTKDGKTAESPFSSDPEGATCVTTLPLA